MRASALAVLLAAAAPATASADQMSSIVVTSPAFGANHAIPTEYTCEGSELSPPLAWSRLPEATRTIAILVEDPDAPGGTFMHWLVTGLPPGMRAIEAGEELPASSVAAKNDKGNLGYAGPCPPSGTHHYRFRVYALDNNPGSVISRADFMTAIRGHILAQGELIGTYRKQGR